MPDLHCDAQASAIRQLQVDVVSPLLLHAEASGRLCTEGVAIGVVQRLVEVDLSGRILCSSIYSNCNMKRR